MITTVHDSLGREWEMRIANQLLATTGRQGSAVDKGREDRIRLRTAEQKALLGETAALTSPKSSVACFSTDTTGFNTNQRSPLTSCLEHSTPFPAVKRRSKSTSMSPRACVTAGLVYALQRSCSRSDSQTFPHQSGKYSLQDKLPQVCGAHRA